LLKINELVDAVNSLLEGPKPPQEESEDKISGIQRMINHQEEIRTDERKRLIYELLNEVGTVHEYIECDIEEGTMDERERVIGIINSKK